MSDQGPPVTPPEGSSIMWRPNKFFGLSNAGTPPEATDLSPEFLGSPCTGYTPYSPAASPTPSGMSGCSPGSGDSGAFRWSSDSPSPTPSPHYQQESDSPASASDSSFSADESESSPDSPSGSSDSSSYASEQSDSPELSPSDKYLYFPKPKKPETSLAPSASRPSASESDSNSDRESSDSSMHYVCTPPPRPKKPFLDQVKLFGKNGNEV